MRSSGLSTHGAGWRCHDVLTPLQAFIIEDEEQTRSLPPNPFSGLTQKELEEYKHTVESRQQGQDGRILPPTIRTSPLPVRMIPSLTVVAKNLVGSCHVHVNQSFTLVPTFSWYRCFGCTCTMQCLCEVMFVTGPTMRYLLFWIFPCRWWRCDRWGWDDHVWRLHHIPVPLSTYDSCQTR